MAIPTRGIRWQIPFKSLKGYDCLVNIYVEGYSGTISQLTGGDVPVFFEDDDSENLLNVVRVKTGYISFIEETYGYWSAVYPTTNLDRYVEVIYNGNLVFRGFLQAQTFENTWESGPREIQIPIISVLGVTKSIRFDPNNLGNEALTTGAVIKKSMQDITVEFGRVVFPYTDGTDSKGNTIPTISLNEALRTLVICPYNSQYDRQEHGTDIYNPCTVYEFLKGVCNAYGWILHEWDSDMVFTKHDHTGKYLWRAFDSLDDLNGRIHEKSNGHVTMDDYISISSDQNTESTIMPVSRLEMNYGTNVIDNGDMDFDRCATYIRVWNSNGHLYYVLTPMSNEFGGNLLKVMEQIEWNSSPVGGRFVNDGCYITFAAQQPGKRYDPWEEVGKGILIQWSTGWANKTRLFWVRLPYPAMSNKMQALGPGGAHTVSMTYVIELELAWAPSLTSSHVGEYFRSDGHADFTIDVGICNQKGKWLDEYGDWVDSEQWRTITIDGSKGTIKKDDDHKYDDEFKILSPIQSDSLFFEFRTNNNDNLSNREAIFFKKIGWAPGGNIFFPELFERPVDKHFDSNNGSDRTVSVDQFLTPYRYCENLIGDDRTNAMFTEYPYIFVAQKELKLDSRHDLPSDPYLHPYTYQGRDDWKLLAVGFDPRNDEYKLTLHTF